MKKRKFKFIDFIIIISLIILLTSTILIIKNSNDIKKIKEEKETIKNIVDYEYDNSTLLENFRIEFKNNDIIAILNIEDIINIPIVKTIDNKYYLKYGINKTKIPGGAPFMDYRTNIGDKQINIYGHNSTKYDLPFKKLENYLDNSYTKNNDIIELKTKDKTYKYIITYIYLDKKSDEDEHYKYKYTDNTSWLKHINTMKQKSIYNNDIELNEYDNILILQTCLFGDNRNKLLLIVAKQFN